MNSWVSFADDTLLGNFEDMEYKEMHVPFELVSFYEMNKKQAEQYFNWFIETKEESKT